MYWDNETKSLETRVAHWAWQQVKDNNHSQVMIEQNHIETFTFDHQERKKLESWDWAHLKDNFLKFFFLIKFFIICPKLWKCHNFELKKIFSLCSSIITNWDLIENVQAPKHMAKRVTGVGGWLGEWKLIWFYLTSPRRFLSLFFIHELQGIIMAKMGL